MYEAARGPALSEEQGLRAAYAAHGGELYGFALRQLGDPGLAEEAVQETFLRAWRAADRFDPEIGSLRTWLFVIMRHVVVDTLRARARSDAASKTDRRQTTENDLDRAMVSWQVEEALRRLSEDHRRVLIETYYRSRPYSEVSAQLGIPEGTVKSRVYYALKALRLALEEMGWTDD